VPPRHHSILLLLPFLSLSLSQPLDSSPSPPSSPSPSLLSSSLWDLSFSRDLLSSQVSLCPGVASVRGLSAAALFLSRSASEPLLVEGLEDLNGEFREATERARLLATHGHLNITLSSANTYSYKKQRATLAEYLELMRAKPGGDDDDDKDGSRTFYFFGNHNLSDFSSLLDVYAVPDLLRARERGTLSFGIGSSGSGVPFHFHGPVLAEVIHGRKRWLLAPFSDRPRFDPDVTSRQWVKEFDGSSPVLDCTVLPGQILFVPDRWWHLTLNQGESVFMTVFV
jgi:hypothetical protein